MQNLANLEVFNQLQATANTKMGFDLGVFNDRVRMGEIHARIKETNSANIKNDPKLAQFVEEEIQEREQQDKSNLTAEQQRELSDWKSMYDYIRRESGIKTTIDDCFKNP